MPKKLKNGFYNIDEFGMDNQEEKKLGRIINLLIEFSKGNFEAKEELSDEDDSLNTVISGLNMLAEELSCARDLQKQIELEKEELIVELSKRYNEMMQFNYIVSHNLRTPVVQIMGLAQLLDHQATENERIAVNKYMFDAAVSMDEMLLDLNTILSTKSSFHAKKENFSLKLVIEAAKGQLSSQLKIANATLFLHIDDDADMLFTIKVYIQSVVFNLVSNAIKYRSPEREPVINFYASRNGELTQLVITDNGMGIDLEVHRERIFKLYSKIHNTDEGKGLGLYMIKTQLESIGGSIEINSQLGKGTTFTISF